MKRIPLLVAIALASGCGRKQGDPTGDAGTDAASTTVALPACPKGMVAIPAGTFEPARAKGTVEVAAFCLDETEVTVEAYAACMRAASCTEPERFRRDNPTMFGEDCNWKHPDDRSRHPINCVDWVQATAFCAWAEKRLPTAEEWEWAARGGDEARRYPWGADAPAADLLNACGAECAKRDRSSHRVGHKAMYAESDGWVGTAPVGSFPKGKSRFGALDMAGNVEEWTSTKQAAGPSDPADGRVFRGGSFSRDAPEAVSASSRTAYLTDLDTPVIGLRCASTP